MRTIGYTENFIKTMKDYAVIGLSPVQVAERMGLEGIERIKFLEDVTDDNHPLYREYFLSARHHREDIDAALNTAAITGDPKALRLEYELRRQDKIDSVKKELFGI